MKYFKKEFWAAMNSDNKDEIAKADADWDRNLADYQKQLEQLRPRLSASASRFFSKVGLHDGTLLSFSLGDALDSTEEIPISRRKTRVRMKVTSGYNGATYTLNYSGIRHIIVDFPSKNPLFYELGGSFGSWGYDELTDAGDGFFRHEILFGSGATITIEFQWFKYERQPKRKSSV